MTSTKISRRTFLRASVVGGGALVAGAGILAALGGIARGPRRFAEGHGPLVPDPAGVLDLPEGFHYRLLSPGLIDSERAGNERFTSLLATGEPTPGLHDGMAAFPGASGLTVLVRNHELNLGNTPIVDAKRARPYDPMTGGGTTTLWVDSDRNLVSAFPSLSGTLRNCAGGRTPWGSWFTAEEDTRMPGAKHAENADLDPGVSQPHGYIFEVDAAARELVDPVPIRAMGRFRHEAVAVDPETGYAYLTEDRDDGLLYRFRPDVLAHGKNPGEFAVGDYAKGGVLEALRVRSKPKLLTRNDAEPGRRKALPAIALGQSYDVDWVRIPNPEPAVDMLHDPDDDKILRTAPTSTRAQGFALGCAQFARTEGIAFGAGSVYFCCTNGGPVKLGQVFRLDLAHDRLSLVVEPDDHAQLDGPDNICVAPFGDLVICEDNLAQRENFVVGVTPRGACYRLARNAHPARREFAGACFAPDGRTLFVNIQSPGMTLALWGPWEQRRA